MILLSRCSISQSKIPRQPPRLVQSAFRQRQRQRCQFASSSATRRPTQRSFSGNNTNNSNNNGDGGGGGGVGGWLFPEQLVANTGSIARDVLAAERTFLAWSRTGLGFVGAGSALFATYHNRHQQQQQEWTAAAAGDALSESSSSSSSPPSVKGATFQTYIYPASALLIANGSVLLLFATRRYLRTVAALRLDQFPIDTRGTLAAVATTAISTMTSLGVVLWGEEYNSQSFPKGTRQEAKKLAAADTTLSTPK